VTCLSRSGLAEAVTEMRDDVSLHLSSCERCRSRFDELVGVRGTVGSVRAATLNKSQVDLLLRAVFVQLDHPLVLEAKGWPWRRTAAAMTVVAAAAAVVIVLFESRPVTVTKAAVLAPFVQPARAAPEDHHGSDTAAETGHEPVIPTPAKTPPPPNRRLHANRVDERQFAGAADVVTPPMTRTEMAPTTSDFADGWARFAKGQYSEAIEAFDRVTDPSTREDAMYWAAVACARKGLRENARERLEHLVHSFPLSQRRTSAARLLESLD